MSTSASSAGVEIGRVAELGDDALGALLGGHRGGREIPPDVGVFHAGKQQHVGVLGRATGAAHLLVVRDGRGRSADVHDEAEVGFVEAHAECAGRDERLDPVGLQKRFGLFALRRIRLTRVRAYVVPRLAQQPRDVLRAAHRQAVDDARSGQVAEMREQPGQARPRIGKAEDAQTQRCPRERSADRHDVDASAGQLLGDIGDHPAVGRRGGGEDRHARGQAADQLAQPPVVGPEVVAPVADAVRFVDDQHPHALDQGGQLLIAEGRIVQALGREQQHVDVVVAQSGRARRPTRARSSS